MTAMPPCVRERPSPSYDPCAALQVRFIGFCVGHTAKQALWSAEWSRDVGWNSNSLLPTEVCQRMVSTRIEDDRSSKNTRCIFSHILVTIEYYWYPSPSVEPEVLPWKNPSTERRLKTVGNFTTLSSPGTTGRGLFFCQRKIHSNFCGNRGDMREC